MAKGLMPVSVPQAARLEYFKCLEEYAVNGNIEPFADFVAGLEEQRLDELLGNIGVKEPLE